MQRCVGSAGAEKPAPSGFLPRLAVPSPPGTSASGEPGSRAWRINTEVAMGWTLLDLKKEATAGLIWLGCQP
jgi:hypothetical protein